MHWGTVYFKPFNKDITMKLRIQPLFALLLTAVFTTAVAAEDMTVSGVHAQRTELAGKQITITGEVIKVNNAVMRRNFIHVQDGTGSGDTDRLIFTSQQTAEVGDTITITGTVAIDTDFGMGYFYATLVEQATITPTLRP